MGSHAQALAAATDLAAGTAGHWTGSDLVRPLLTHPTLPPRAARRLIDAVTDHHDMTLARMCHDALATRTDLPASVLKRMTAHTNSSVRQLAARSVSITEKAARQLADDEHLDVRVALASNVAVPADVLDVCAADSRWEVRAAAAANPTTRAATVAGLADDRSKHVGPAAVDALLERAWTSGDKRAAKAVCALTVTQVLDARPANTPDWKARPAPNLLRAAVALELAGHTARVVTATSARGNADTLLTDLDADC